MMKELLLGIVGVTALLELPLGVRHTVIRTLLIQLVWYDRNLINSGLWTIVLHFSCQSFA